MRFLISYLPPESLVGGAMFGSSPPLSGGRLGGGKRVDWSAIMALTGTFVPHPNPPLKKGREQTRAHGSHITAAQNDS